MKEQDKTPEQVSDIEISSYLREFAEYMRQNR